MMQTSLSGMPPHINLHVPAPHAKSSEHNFQPNGVTAPSDIKPDHSRISDSNSKAHVSTEQQSIIHALKTSDRQVRSHEQAHLSAAGQLATGGATFTFKQGPDGVHYAVAGEVNIDTSAIADDPAATLRKAEIIKRAALAPAQPSAQDRNVAAQATTMANQAQAELLQENIQTILSSNFDKTTSQSSNIDMLA